MLKTLWLLDALLLVAALAVALMNSGQDSAGRGMMWFFPLAMAFGLAGSWALERSGAHKAAIAVGLIAPLLAGTVGIPMARSELAVRREKGGATYWDDPKLQRLARAIEQGDSAAVRAAASGVDLNTVGGEGMTPLTFAIAHGQQNVGMLITLGANPNLSTEGFLSPMGRALKESGPAFDLLLAGGANPNGIADYDAPVIFGAIDSDRPQTVDTLIARGADVKLLDANGGTTLMAAAQNRQWTLARRLLALGVDPAIVARNGATLASVIERVTRNSGSDAEFAAFMAELAARTDSPHRP